MTETTEIEDKIHPLNGPFVLFSSLIWLMLALRWLADLGFSGTGILSDLSTIFLAFACLNLSFLSLKFSGAALRSFGFGLLLFLAACFVIYFRFFQSFPSWSSFQALPQLGAALNSVTALFKTADLLWAIGLVIVFLLGQERSSLPKKAVVFMSLASTAVGIACLSASTSLQAQAFVSEQHNPFIYLARGASTQSETRAGDSADKILSVLHEPYADKYEVATLDKYPLYRKALQKTQTPQRPMNVVLIFMESFRALEGGLTDTQSPYPQYGTELKKLAQTGWFFPQFYSNAHQTVRAELSMLCSVYPFLNNKHLMAYLRQDDYAVRCLPEILADAGYHTTWISSYDSDYTNKKHFLSLHGMQQILDDEAMKNWPLKEPKVGWGASDLDLLDFSLDKLNEMPEPFFTEIMTLSNHHPFADNYNIPQDHIPIQPENEIYGRYARGIHFTDYAVGRFMEKASQQPWYNNTLFVFMGDHGIWTFPHTIDLGGVYRTEIFYRTGLLMWSPGMNPRKFEDRFGSLVDFAPTLMDVLGLQSDHAFMGKSLMNDSIPNDKRYAIMVNETSWNIRRGNQYCFSSGHTCFVNAFPYCPDGIEPNQTGHACFESSEDLLNFKSDVRMLNDAEQEELLDFGFGILTLNQKLHAENAYYPPEARTKP